MAAAKRRVQEAIESDLPSGHPRPAPADPGTTMATVVADVVGEPAEKAVRHDIAVTVDVDVGPTVPPHPAEAVFNLVDDALDAAVGSVLITAGVSDGEAVLTVDDDGPGLDAVASRQVFEPFFTTNRPAPAWGSPSPMRWSTTSAGGSATYGGRGPRASCSPSPKGPAPPPPSPAPLDT